jgi:hypothetical protein
VVQFIGHPAFYDIAQVFEVYKVTGIRINISFYRDKKNIVMAVPVRVCAFSEDLQVFSIIPFGPEEPVGGVELLPA